eukprot:CAMPEP_0181204706 /NCGR_PEP_ID=MMETSP1096-20121128/20079_1 /TAXON_ID=156174 ORGANISM="Chrysochromulina ericina, Strain CCMP281" /NCGR_SAMPLE_ID=MMETSP1096 /ASSEMBLY_ACC=CAM_ASM_000453 /LENGTH=172 /DNA_ID=CAMNT_0023295425 /DNA_START=1254 /DNA_END=1769 /DNA_ORIENTATION=-
MAAVGVGVCRVCQRGHSSFARAGLHCAYEPAPLQLPFSASDQYLSAWASSACRRSPHSCHAPLFPEPRADLHLVATCELELRLGVRALAFRLRSCTPSASALMAAPMPKHSGVWMYSYLRCIGFESPGERSFASSSVVKVWSMSRTTGASTEGITVSPAHRGPALLISAAFQ